MGSVNYVELARIANTYDKLNEEVSNSLADCNWPTWSILQG